MDAGRGDKLSFVKADDTVVEGEKSEWKKIVKNDRVTVSWKMRETPLKASKIHVLTRPVDAGKNR